MTYSPLPLRQRRSQRKAIKRTSRGYIKDAVLQRLTDRYGASWPDDLSRHIDSGGEFYILIIAT